MKKSLICLIVVVTLMMSGVPSVFAKNVPAKKKEATENKQAAGNQGVFLETIGFLSAQSLYLTYISIGTTADGFAKETYDQDAATQLIQTYQNFTTGAKDQLNLVLTEGNLSEEDTDIINNIIAGFDLLNAEATSYLSYIETGDEKYINQFTKQKDKAWKHIAELMGLEE